MKSKHSDIEAITLRRATIADTDKVRYRVYSTPTEFIAVIAESALMAVKVSGVKKPHKIVRDLPTEGIAIEAKKMAAVDHEAARITLPIKKFEKQEQLTTQLQDVDPKARQALFRPMKIGELQANGMKRARILPPELLNEIIEQHAKGAVQPPAAPAQPSAHIPDPFARAEPEPMLPSVLTDMEPEVPPPASANEPGVLSPEEVERLLNES